MWLTITTAGEGSGVAFPRDEYRFPPPGCQGSSCTYAIPTGLTVTLAAAAWRGSVFTGWSGAHCSGTGICRVTMSGNRSVTATFAPPSDHLCVAPRLKGKTLKAAKRTLSAHSCALGRVKRTNSRTVKKGHVISQTPKPGAVSELGTKINVVVSKGSRP